MATGMGSPERNPIVPSSDGQGSPFFHFLCSLSPIKPVRSGHVAAQAFSELSFAPPPSVFVSPKESSRSRSAEDERRQKDNTSYTKRKIFTSMLDNTMTGKKSKFTNESSLLASPVKNKLTPKQQEHLTSSNSNSPINLDTNLMGGDKLGATNSCAVPCGLSVKEESLDATSRINLVPQDYDTGLKNFELHPLATMCEYANEKGIPNDFTCGNPVNGSGIASWREDIPSRQIPSILSAPMQRTAEEIIQKIDLHGNVDSYSMPTHIHSNEQMCEESAQQVSCRAGIRRRCLDFETLEDQKRSSEHDPLSHISLDKSCHSNFLNTLGMKSDFHTTPTCTTTTTAHTASNVHLVSRYTMDNPTMFASTNEHALYPPLQPELEICARASNFDAPRLNPNELSYKIPAMHTYPCIHQSHESPSIDIDNSYGHVPTNVSRDSNTSHSHGNHYNVSGNNLDLEAVLSLVERISMKPPDVSKSLSSDAHVGGLGMQNSCFPANFDIDSIHNLENRLFTCGAAPPEISHCHQSESNHAEDDSGHISSDCGSNKKRKLSIDDKPSGEGCKNCKCKKSKCLKLYCECFAAGVYCVGGCRCSNCYNRPEFEDIVLQTREQIESRNPSAFVPKIIRAPVSSPTTIGEECVDVTPAPTRHKRGCNCKKSQCSKKYCECYQAGIGCGEGCRCEGCRNIFGRKEGSAEVDENEQQKTPVETMSSSNDEMIQMDSRPTPDHHPQSDQKNRVLSPVTPYLNEHSGPYVQPLVKSGEQSCSPFTLSVLPTMAFNSPCRIFEALEGSQNFGQIPMNPQSNLSTFHHNLTDAPSHPDGLGDLYSLHRPLPQLSEDDYTLYSRISTSQSYWQNQGHSIPTELPGLTSQESSSLIEHLRPSIFPSDNYQFHTREHDSLTVPVTPLLPSSSSVARRNFEDLDEMSETPSGSRVWLGDENSPNAYNDSNSFCAPEIVLKTRSPQQKRVFSHHHHHQNSKSDGREIVSPGSAFKNGRKFILHALPSSSSSSREHDTPIH